MWKAHVNHTGSLWCSTSSFTFKMSTVGFRKWCFAGKWWYWEFCMFVRLSSGSLCVFRFSIPATRKSLSSFLTYTSPSALVQIIEMIVNYFKITDFSNHLFLKNMILSEKNTILQMVFLLFLYVCAVHSSRLYSWDDNKRLFVKKVLCCYKH